MTICVNGESTLLHNAKPLNSESHRIRFMYAKKEFACQQMCFQIGQSQLHLRKIHCITLIQTHYTKNYNLVYSASDPSSISNPMVPNYVTNIPNYTPKYYNSRI